MAGDSMTRLVEASEAFSGLGGTQTSPRSNKSFLPVLTRLERQERGKLMAERQRQKLDEWSKLDLKQDWLDRDFMVANASAAGIRRLPPAVEPYTQKRLESYPRRTGYGRLDFKRATRLTTAQWCERNKRVPLWAAVCLAAESIRR